MSDDGILEPLDVMREPSQDPARRSPSRPSAGSSPGGILESLDDLAYQWRTAMSANGIVGAIVSDQNVRPMRQK